MRFGTNLVYPWRQLGEYFVRIWGCTFYQLVLTQMITDGFQEFALEDLEQKILILPK